jgi:hypothetical protein
MWSLSSYILCIAAVAVLCAAAEIMMSDGKTQKYVKYALSIIMVFIIINPLAEIFRRGADINQIIKEDIVQNDYAYIGVINEQRARALERAVQSHLKSKGFGGVKARIIYTGDKQGITVDYVYLDLTNFEFNGGGEHIHIIDNVIGLTADYLNISRERVGVYGENQ